MCLQTQGQGPPCSGLQRTWARLQSPVLDCKLGFCKHFNPANLHGPQPQQVLHRALTTREKLAHAPRLSSDWSMSWFTLVSLANTGPCKHFLPFVNRKCHTLAPPPTVTTHHPQTLGNGDNWGLAGKYRVCHHGEWLIGCHNICYIIALIIILRGPNWVIGLNTDMDTNKNMRESDGLFAKCIPYSCSLNPRSYSKWCVNMWSVPRCDAANHVWV